MNCNDIRERFIDYIDGVLPADEKRLVEEHLAGCETCRSELADLTGIQSRLAVFPQEEPGEAMTGRFYAMIDRYAAEEVSRGAGHPGTGGRAAQKQSPFNLHRLYTAAAAAVILVVGFTSGSVFERVRSNGREIDGIKSEMTEMRQLLTTSLLTQDSAVERLRGISLSREVTDPDDRFVSALITSLNTDPDVNVRLAAAEAIQRYGDREWVRTQVVESLSYQSSPLVQIALIELYADIKDKQALPALKAVAEDDTSLEPVKARARLAMERLM